jgi:hypothetical protein
MDSDHGSDGAERGVGVHVAEGAAQAEARQDDLVTHVHEGRDRPTFAGPLPQGYLWARLFDHEDGFAMGVRLVEPDPGIDPTPPVSTIRSSSVLETTSASR